jgi:hypothetical protein
MSGGYAFRTILGMLVGVCCVLSCRPWLQAQTVADAISQCPRRTGVPDKHIKVVYYDARQEKFFYENGAPIIGALEIGDHVVLEVCHARFGEQFNFTLTEKALPEAGAPVRGLDDVVGLIKGLPGSPGAKGVGQLESVKFTPYPDVDTVIARLRSLQDIVGVRTELQQDLESFLYGTTIIEEDYKKFRRAICQMTTQITASDCPLLGMPLSATSGMPPRVDTVETRLQSLIGEVNQAASAASVPRGPNAFCPSSTLAGPQYRDRNQFVCFVNHTNLIIGQFRNLRTMIEQPPLASAAADLDFTARRIQASHTYV